MIRRYMTIDAGAPEGDKPGGDCFRACIASVLELDVEHVPHFVQQAHEAHEGQADAGELANEFLAPIGVGLVFVHVEGAAEELGPYLPTAWTILIGKNAQGADHAVVGWGLKPVHDPAPDGRRGLAEIEQAAFFVAIHPERLLGD